MTIMRIFEFIFNPKLKKDLIFDSFCYKPENIYEKDKGHLCMVGLLRNTLPTNIYLIKKIARMIKDKYFKSTDSDLHKSFKDSLKVVNRFLARKSNNGDTSWLGNLSFLALSLKKRRLFFSKTGDIKFLVVRNKEIIDIDEKTKYNEVSTYPVKVFARTISSKLSKKDFILILTREIYDYLKKKKILKKIIEPNNFNEKEIRKILKKRKKEISRVKGVFLGISLRDIQKEKSKKTTLKKLKDVPWKKMFNSFSESLQKKGFPKIKFPTPKKKKLKLKAFKKDLSFFSRKIKPFFTSKKALFLVPIFLLVIGFSFYNIEKRNQIKTYKEELSIVNNKISQANEILSDKNSNPELLRDANNLLQESWITLSSLEEKSKGSSEELSSSINSSQEEIEPILKEINNIQDIDNPSLFFSFKKDDFQPQKVISLNNDFYFSSPENKKIISLDNKKEGQTIQINKKINSLSIINNRLVLFSKPNQIITLKNNFPTYYSLNDKDLSYDFFNTFANNLYFLNKETGKIIKHPFLGNLTWGSGKDWFSSDEDLEKNKGTESFTIDRSIWVLNNNKIYEYYTGKLKKEISLDIFPKVKSLAKIKTTSNISNIYLLEPKQKRIIILDKSGEFKKQIRSDKFNNLSDIEISSDEKELFILSGSNFYKIEL